MFAYDERRVSQSKLTTKPHTCISHCGILKREEKQKAFFYKTKFWRRLTTTDKTK